MPDEVDPAKRTQRQVIRRWIVRAKRRTVQLNALAHRIDGSCVEVTISDLSFDGCCLISPELFEPAEVLIVKVPGLGQAEAEVRWVIDNRIGVLFTEHVPVPTALRAARRRERTRS